MKSPAESVEPSSVVIGLLTLAVLIGGLLGSIAYRVAFKEQFRRQMATTPQRVIDPRRARQAAGVDYGVASKHADAAPAERAAMIPTSADSRGAVPTRFSDAISPAPSQPTGLSQHERGVPLKSPAATSKSPPTTATPTAKTPSMPHFVAPTSR